MEYPVQNESAHGGKLWLSNGRCLVIMKEGQ
jgi:hypothetical protein